MGCLPIQPRRQAWLRWALALWLASCALSMAHAEELSREYRIKAAFLYNLSKFITWPEETSWTAEKPVNICVFGFNPFDTYLEKLSSRTVKGHPIALRYIIDEPAAADCQLLFISQYNTRQPDLSRLADRTPALLTVGDDPDFVAHGGMIGLVAVGNNVQMDINLTLARKKGFAISASLLEIAHSIK